MTPLLVIVPTHKRYELLDRTLRSLADCRIPPSLTGVVVVENGSRSGAEKLVSGYQSALPMRYLFSEDGNKSRALNKALQGAGNRFVVFFDDDVRIHPDTLVSYAREVGDQERGLFLAGRCLPEYEEEPPPAWLQPYLPHCAMGWTPASVKQPLTTPDALGFNWGAFAADIASAGGFDERRGPGTGALGDETTLQQRLLANGVAGFYIPDALVWHFVPRERCNPDWAASRIERVALSFGMDLRSAPRARQLQRGLVAWTKMIGMTAALRTASGAMQEPRRYHLQYWASYYRGLLRGLRTRD